MFNELNTDGFTAAQITMLNDALAVRTARGEDEKSASDAINNAWFDGATVDQLVA